MKLLLMFLACLFAAFVFGQKPDYVPFETIGHHGIMKTDGTLISEKSELSYAPYVVGNFKSYILRYNTDSLDFFMDAITGQTGITGILDRKCGELRIANSIWYHFLIGGTSVLVSQEQEQISLPKTYLNIEPNEQAWSNEELPDKQYIWALKKDQSYEVLLYKNGIINMVNLPSFENYDLLFSSTKADPMQPVGFVLGNLDAIDREFGEMYGIAESDKKVDVYDLEFNKLGKSVYSNKALSAFFKKKIQRRGSMIPPPESKNQIINSTGKPIILNEEFSLVPDKMDPDELVLVNTKQNNKPVLGNDAFDYRYYSTPQNLKALLQIRQRETESIFFFDFDGKFFPRGKPMMPKDLIAGN